MVKSNKNYLTPQRGNDKFWLFKMDCIPHKDDKRRIISILAPKLVATKKLRINSETG